MTCAVTEAVMNGGKRDDFIDAMKKYGAMYPNVGYGIKFLEWLMSDNREPYHSFGNGSAMRDSLCAWIMDCSFYARIGMLPERGRIKEVDTVEGKLTMMDGLEISLGSVRHVCSPLIPDVMNWL